MTSAEFKAALAAAQLSRRSLALTLGVHVVTVNRWACGVLDVPQYAAAYLILAAQINHAHCS
jgi:DNA-binding transcriptional regulator YiaG